MSEQENDSGGIQKATPQESKKWPRWVKPFLKVFSQRGNILRAAKAARVSRGRVYRFRDENPEFARRMELAKEDAGDSLIDEAVRRGRDGYEEPVIWQGQLCMVAVDQSGRPCRPDDPGATWRPLTIIKFSDTLLIKTVQWLRPDLREGKLEVSGPGGGAIKTETVTRPDLSKLSPEELALAYDLGTRMLTPDGPDDKAGDGPTPV